MNLKLTWSFKWNLLFNKLVIAFLSNMVKKQPEEVFFVLFYFFFHKRILLLLNQDDVSKKKNLSLQF